MHDVVTFSEAMIRLSPPGFQRVEQTNSLDIQIGGAEYNVACAAARLGLKAAWVSRLPDNPLGRRIANKAREHGVDTSSIVWAKEGRVGIYFLELGAAPRPSSVLYDRAPSAIAQIKPGEVDWKKVLGGAKWFHVSGITPALSDSAAQTTAEAVAVAKSAGVKVSYDLNYRKKLWSAVALESGKFHEGPRYELEIVDRLGGGDSFAAGMLYGLATKDSLENGLKFGLAFSALKHSNPGDLNWSTCEEVEDLMKGGSVRVSR
jgi:sugar/nucleoside kinase (ribokinase family)